MMKILKGKKKKGDHIGHLQTKISNLVIEVENSDDERLEALKKHGDEMRCKGNMPSSHTLWPEVDRVVREHLALCDPTARELTAEAGWQLIAKDGEMVIYKREMENSDGIVLDPLQAMHTVEGVTARELCTYFWDVQYRMDWEITVDQPPRILEACGEDTVVMHQIYKRIWPASQRDSVFWSHIRRCELPGATGQSEEGDKELSNVTNGESEDMWMVMNYSTDRNAPSVDSLPNKMIRLELDVTLICQTIIDGPRVPGETITRDRIRSRLLYASSINPGGWAPASALRAMAKREYPRFIKQFSKYVIDKTAKTPIFM